MFYFYFAFLDHNFLGQKNVSCVAGWLKINNLGNLCRIVRNLEGLAMVVQSAFALVITCLGGRFGINCINAFLEILKFCNFKLFKNYKVNQMCGHWLIGLIKTNKHFVLKLISLLTASNYNQWAGNYKITLFEAMMSNCVINTLTNTFLKFGRGYTESGNCTNYKP